MAAIDPTARDLDLVKDTDIEEALNPVEVEGVFRDTRECAELALVSGGTQLLLSPPTPRPKKADGIA